MIWWIAATLISSFIKGVCGFANTLVFTSMLNFTADPVRITPVGLILSWPGNLVMCWKERRSIPWRFSLLVCLLVAAGMVPGILLLKSVDSGLIKLGFGVVIMLLALDMMIREKRPAKKETSRAGLLFVGILSGLLCGLYGIGALISVCFSRISKDMSAFKGGMCFVFSVENTLRLILYAVMGVITLESLWMGALMMPLMFLGLWMGMRLSSRMDERLVRRSVLIMLLVSGAALVWSNWPM